LFGDPVKQEDETLGGNMAWLDSAEPHLPCDECVFCHKEQRKMQKKLRPSKRGREQDAEENDPAPKVVAPFLAFNSS
jgi:hypothetical protein